MINSDQVAWEFLRFRVPRINATGRHRSVILCGPGPFVERLRALGCEVIVVETPRALRPLRIARSIAEVARVLRQGRFDVIHTHAQIVGLVGRVAARLAGTQVVIHQVHAFHHHPWMHPMERWIFVTAERVLALLSDYLLFQSSDDLAECARARIAPARKCRLVGNGIDLARFDTAISEQQSPPIILCVGRLERTKNQAMLLEAARRLEERGVEFELQIAGEGRDRAEIEALIAKYELRDRVRLLGYREDIPELTASAAICVRVSLKEGLPRGLMEAAASGRPAVATDVGGNREVIAHGQTGFLVPVGDAAALCERLAQLLGSPQLRAEMGAAARRRARARFDEGAPTERLIALYDEIGRTLPAAPSARRRPP